jgi:hypothetical protein
VPVHASQKRYSHVSLTASGAVSCEVKPAVFLPQDPALGVGKIRHAGLSACHVLSYRATHTKSLTCLGSPIE